MMGLGICRVVLIKLNNMINQAIRFVILVCILLFVAADPLVLPLFFDK